MDGRLQARIDSVVSELARQHQQELEAAGTLVDLEELTCQIGDEVTRQLTERELVRRGGEYDAQPAACPDCGRECLPDAERDPVVLAGLRGEIAYAQPKHFCDRCRRSFFPSGGALGSAGPQPRNDQGVAEGRVGGGQ